MEWVKQESHDLWRPKQINEELEGEVTQIEDGAYGKQYVILTKNGSIKTTSQKVLQAKMQHVKVGDIIKIVFLGQKTTLIQGHKPTSLYDVYRQENKVEEVI